MRHITQVSLLILLLCVVVSCEQPTQTSPVTPLSSEQPVHVTTVALPVGTSEAVKKTATGFYWPTGTDQLGGYWSWLGDRCSWSGNSTYDTGLYHIGQDIKADLEAPVYAISDGRVLSLSPNDWGAGNVALVIEHWLADGSSFIAVYGHIRSVLQIGDSVQGGKPFAEVGPWPAGTHLHFGIRPGTSTEGPFGRMPCPPQGPITNTNGFVDPIEWITTRSPGGDPGTEGPIVSSMTAEAKPSPTDAPSPTLTPTDTPLPPTPKARTGAPLIAFVYDESDSGPTRSSLGVTSSEGTDCRVLYTGTPEEYLDDPQWSPDGSRILLGGNGLSYLIDPDRPQEPLQQYWGSAPRWLPDSRHILFLAYRSDPARRYIAIANLEGEIVQEYEIIDPEPAADHQKYLYPALLPSVSPDGREVAFVSRKEGPQGRTVENLYVLSTDTGETRQLTYFQSPLDITRPNWFPDSERLMFGYFDHVNAGSGPVVAIVYLEDATLQVIAQKAWWPLLSPDGTQMAYETADSLWVSKPDGSDAVNLGTGHDVSWTPDSSRILYDLELINKDGSGRMQIPFDSCEWIDSYDSALDRSHSWFWQTARGFAMQP